MREVARISALAKSLVAPSWRSLALATLAVTALAHRAEAKIVVDRCEWATAHELKDGFAQCSSLPLVLADRLARRASARFLACDPFQVVYVVPSLRPWSRTGAGTALVVCAVRP